MIFLIDHNVKKNLVWTELQPLPKYIIVFVSLHNRKQWKEMAAIFDSKKKFLQLCVPFSLLRLN